MAMHGRHRSPTCREDQDKVGPLRTSHVNLRVSISSVSEKNAALPTALILDGESLGSLGACSGRVLMISVGALHSIVLAQGGGNDGERGPD